MLRYRAAGDRDWNRLHKAVNRKRVQRIYREEGLQVSGRKRRRGVAVERRALEVPLAPNEV